MQTTVRGLLAASDTPQRVLIFAGSVAAANTAARALEEASVDVLLYHKEVPAAQRAEAIKTISQCVDKACKFCTVGVCIEEEWQQFHVMAIVRPDALSMHAVLMNQAVGVRSAVCYPFDRA